MWHYGRFSNIQSQLKSFSWCFMIHIPAMVFFSTCTQGLFYTLYMHLQSAIYHIVVPSLQQHCSGRCGTYISINITLPESLIIPCGSLQPSNTSMVDYCNATGGTNEPLAEGATSQYNLTTTEISHHNNIIYCTDNQVIFCYRLNVFCKKVLY